jgi:hypothetical protein
MVLDSWVKLASSGNHSGAGTTLKFCFWTYKMCLAMYLLERLLIAYVFVMAPRRGGTSFVWMMRWILWNFHCQNPQKIIRLIAQIAG